jgi:hypothetical protein
MQGGTSRVTGPRASTRGRSGGRRERATARGDEDFRREVWRSHGATAEEAGALLAYARCEVPPQALRGEVGCPLPDEPFVAAWEAYQAEARRDGAASSLRRHLVQLRFPVAEGTSGEPAYLGATRRGAPAPEEGGLVFADGGGLHLRIQATPAGRIPVIVAGDRRDFVALVQALAHRNEPRPIPESMGALAVAGYNNWSRIGALKQAWLGEHPGAGEAEWKEAFAALRAQRELYQDRFLVLSSGPYSGLPARAVGCGADEWIEASLRIRLEHECVHYFTRRVFGAMRNSMLDELVADYVGIVAVAGRFRADWFLGFMGLEDPSRPRPGGRLENYRGDPPLSDGAMAVLRRVVRQAALALDGFEPPPPGGGADQDKAAAITALAAVGLEGLAGPRPGPRLAAALAAARPRRGDGAR